MKNQEGIRIGRLAERTGLSIRTLHYYDEIGLLKPSQRTESGHRLYDKEDVVRLGKIISLRALDFSLEEIGECLDGAEFPLRSILTMHRARLKRQMNEMEELYGRLARLEEHMNRVEEVSTEEFIRTIEGITMVEKYYTKEQLEELKERAERIGDEQMREYERQWGELIAAARAEMEKGSDPQSEPVQELARRWRGLVEAFTGGNPGIRDSLQKMYDQEGPEKASRGMADPAVFEFMGKAMQSGTERPER